ncbi:MAG TPA: cation:dicarboxylase symporter family transporter, partial [Bdellovibrionota bacterium]
MLGTIFPGGQLKPASELGKLVIHWVKLIAGPFLFLTIVASVVEVSLSAGHALRVVAIALFNTAISICIGIGLASFFLSDLHLDLSLAIPPKQPEFTLGFSSWIKTLQPTSLFAPFVQNDILLLGLLGVCTGLALRSMFAAEGERKMAQLAQLCLRLRDLPGVFLRWIIQLIPLAVLSVVAGSVSEYGLGIFATLLRYVGVVLLGFFLQVVFVYGTWICLVARIPVKKFFQVVKGPLSYSFGVNSSLATLPLTLKALKELGVSSRSASLGAGVATNLNNDGIVLYEAMAVFFIAKFTNTPLSDTQMLVAAIACIVASMGITGIPEAGFIS